MKARIKFSKIGSMKFIGHLDIMRYFQKTFRRADVEVEYSQGFSPHQLISFAAPLGVGLTSDGEYLDMQLTSCGSSKEMVELINKEMVEGIFVTQFRILPEKSKNAMSIVAAADYEVSVKDGYESEDGVALFEEFEKKFKDFLNQSEILIMKKTKKSEKEVDIKPMIYKTSYTKEGFEQETGHEFISHAQEYENGIKVYMRISTGSAANLKPELVMQAFCTYAGIPYNELAFQVHRIEVYADQGTEDKPVLVSLGDLAEEKV